MAVGRTLVFATLVNRSFTQSVFRTLRVPSRLLWLMLGLTLALLLVALRVPAARALFCFGPVPAAAHRHLT